MNSLVCQDCGVLFAFKKSHGRRPLMFCSRPCSARAINSTRKHDHTGQRFGFLRVLGPAAKSGKWQCECDCGAAREVNGPALRRGQTRSCGTCSRVRRLEGQSFGRLTAIEYSGSQRWTCVCECGNATEVHRSSLVNGRTRSCGCLQSESSYARSQENRIYTAEEYMARRKQINAENVLSLSDTYVRGALRLRGVERQRISPALIELKREQLTLLRLTKQMKQVIEDRSES